MKHASPNEIKTILEEMTLKRVIFRRPKTQSGVIIEMLANNSEEITISEQGTPDPILFPTTEIISFFKSLDLFSEKYHQTILDARAYCPSSFDFLRSKPEMTMAEFWALYEKHAQGRVKQYANTQALDVDEIELELEDVLPTTKDGLDESFSELDEANQETHQSYQKFVEKYLTTANLMRVTGLLIIVELLVTVFFAPIAPIMKHVIYICAGLNIVVSIWFLFAERSNSNPSSMQMQRFIWLCLIVFNLAMLLTYLLSKAIIYYGALATLGSSHLR